MLENTASLVMEAIREASKETTIKDVKELSPLQASMETIENTSLESLKIQNENQLLEAQDLKRPEINESDNNETRGLTDKEKEYYKDKLNCSDHLLDNAKIDSGGKIYINTINDNKEGPNGVYIRKIIVVNGVEVEGVFPKFDAVMEIQLPENLHVDTDAKQIGYCNQELKESVARKPELAEQFTRDQIEQVENGETPDGYTWHHCEEPGKMQLVKTCDHQATRHTGGKAIWGGGKENR